MQEKRISGCRGGVGGADEAVSIETNYWRDRKERSAGSEMRREGGAKRGVIESEHIDG